MLKRRSTNMSSKEKENVKPDPIELSKENKPKKLVTQILGDRYMDTQKTQKWLQTEFENDWKMEV